MHRCKVRRWTERTSHHDPEPGVRGGQRARRFVVHVERLKTVRPDMAMSWRRSRTLVEDRQACWDRVRPTKAATVRSSY